MTEYPTGQKEAGTMLSFKSQARDSCANILASPLPSNTSAADLISTQIKSDLGAYPEATSALALELGLFSQDYTLNNTGIYSAIVRGKVEGGLMATYFRSVDFLNPFELINSHSHSPPYNYSKIDTNLNFTLSFESSTSLISNF